MHRTLFSLLLTSVACLGCMALAEHADRHGHRCLHDEMKQAAPPTVRQRYNTTTPGMAVDRGFHRAMPGVQAVVPPAATFEPMRIRSFYNIDKVGECTQVGAVVPVYRFATQQTCTQADIVSAQKRTYFQTLLANAVTKVATMLNVARVAGQLEPPTVCGASPGITTNGSIPDADFVMYATAVPLPTQMSSSTAAAWASSCAFDQAGRPIAGHINFVPRMFSKFVTTPSDLQYQADLHLTIHELFHLLGFTAPFFRKGVNGNIDDGGISTYASPKLGKTVSKMVSPKVVQRARAYFGCPTLDGVELEDQGGTGTAGSHWEKRILGDEFITGQVTTVKTFISTITLAFFEDTGLYTANYAAAEEDQMVWGKNTGCDITDNKCNSGLPGAKKTFCFDVKAGDTCVNGRQAIGQCRIITYDVDLPAANQYFGDATVGGRDLQDYCPTAAAYSNNICADATQNDLQALEPYGSRFGAKSVCLVSSLIEDFYPPQTTAKPRCFVTVCASDGRVSITLNGQTVQCPADGSASNVSVAGFLGTIECPVSQELCGKTPPKPTTTAKPPTARPPTTQPVTTRGTTAHPTTQKPTTRAPTTRAGTARATTARPPTAKPLTATPTSRPATVRATTGRPLTAKPTTRVTVRGTTARPTMQKPTTRAPTTRASTARATTARSPTARPPTAKPLTAKPTSRPATVRATTGRPLTAKPTTRRPTAAKP